jgi:hypothetical protein
MSVLSVPPISLPLPPFPVPGERPRPAPGPAGPRPRNVRRTLPRRTPPARPLLPERPAIFPWLERRFSSGEATVWIGDDRTVSGLLDLLYAGNARARGRISLVEGAHPLDPYELGSIGRRLGVAPEEVLDRVRIARAFTAYQLVAIVDGWAREIRRARPTLLVAHDLPSAFDDGEVPPAERAALLGHVAGTLRAIAEESRVPMLLTLRTDPSGFPGLVDRGPRLFDVVRCRARDGPLALEAYREAGRLTIVGRPDGQRGLEEFAGDAPKEVTLGWDAPRRRTGRPWRSG